MNTNLNPNIEFEKEYNTIINANLNRNLLSVNNGHFQEVGFLGRIWRRFMALFRHNAFDDCKSITVAKAIVKLVLESPLNIDQRKALENKLRELRGKVKLEANQKALDSEIAQIQKEEKSTDISSRLDKNCRYAKQQQDQERAKGFAISTIGEAPETTVHPNCQSYTIKIDGEQKDIAGKQVGIASSQGIRPTMEDAEVAESVLFDLSSNETHSFDVFGIFDGHGGAEASAFVKKNMIAYLQTALKDNNPQRLTDEGIFKALKVCFQKLDADYPYLEAGTTATVAVILDGKIWVANVGDSRTILVDKKGKTVQCSEDAKPLMARYQKTVKKLGGKVEYNRIEGRLAVARAIGDKGILGTDSQICCVSPNPKITCFSFNDFKDGHLVLACDGLYEAATTNEIGLAIHQMAEKKETVGSMSRHLVANAIKNGSDDNVSAIVVRL